MNQKYEKKKKKKNDCRALEVSQRGHDLDIASPRKEENQKQNKKLVPEMTPKLLALELGLLPAEAEWTNPIAASWQKCEDEKGKYY